MFEEFAFSGLAIVDENKKPPSFGPKSHQKRRGQDRKAINETRRALAANYKAQGNDFFKQGRYVEAIQKYNEAAKTHGLQPVVMSNLAAVYLKLEQYELAEWAADCALVHAPSMAKARFRRAVARKGQGMFKAAETDLKVVVSRHPDILEAWDELVKVQSERKKYGDGVRADHTCDNEFPPFDGEEWDPLLDSDSEDAKHVGNNRACKFYNHGGCRRGSLCEYSHAPDKRSVRDELGQNVCLQFLLEKCKYGEKCVYAHIMEHLPKGWWNTPHDLETTSLDEFDTDANAKSIEKSAAYIRFKRAQDYQRGFELYSRIPADVLKSRIQNKDLNKGSSKSPSENNRFVLVVCLDQADMFNRIHGHLLNALRTKLKVVHARTVSEVATHLDVPELMGVVVADAGIVERSNLAIVSPLVAYVKQGGSVVFCGLFSSFVRPNELQRFFSRNFGLQWKSGSYFRTTFYKNTQNDLVKDNPSLDDSYSMKALHIKNIASESALYTAKETSHLESLVFAPTPISNFDESPAVSACVGNGRVSYLGDVNAEESSTDTVLAMLGLLNAPSSQ